MMQPNRRQLPRGFRHPSRQARNIADSIPPPIGGLNGRDALANMKPTDAIILDNYFPETNYVSLRKGYASHVTGITGNIDTLMEWAGPAGRKLKAANATDIFDVSSAGAVGGAELSSLTNGKWQHTMMATSGGNFLIIANGADSVRSYDGTNWATPAITVATSSTFIHVVQHKRRLWFTQVATTKAWYLPVDSIAGAATAFDLGPEFTMGGYLQAIGTWTLDGGAGLDDYIVFMSSIGECVIYQGTDPASATTWSKVGTFPIGAPIGRRCMLKTGGDLALVTQDGVVSLSRMLSLDRAASDQASITGKINNLFAEAVLAYGGNFGWQPVSYPRGKYVLFNIPVSATVSWQYVMNTLTGAWCRFLNQNAFCWAVFNDALYFGGSTKVFKADTGADDNDMFTVGEIKTAFNYFKRRGQYKRFHMIRPVIASNGSPQAAIELNVDFEDRVPTDVPAGSLEGALWDTARWDVDVWSGVNDITKNWTAVSGAGYCAAIHLKTQTIGLTSRINVFDIQFELGGAL